jgi:starch phosphorylase
MKAALNGALNCSILDGWWDECFNGSNGWAIESADDDPDLDRRDLREAGSLFGILENQLVPRFYDRGRDGVPRQWVDMVLKAWASLGPEVTAARMVRDYTTALYEPAARDAIHLTSDGAAPAAALAAWRTRVAAAWDGVSITSVELDDEAPQAGESRIVTVHVDLGGLSGDDVVVQCVHGRVGHDGEFDSTSVVPLDATGPGTYAGTVTIAAAGTHGVSARVIPVHADLASPFDLGRIAWAT